MAAIDYSYTPGGQRLSTNAGAYGGGGGGGGMGFNPAAFEEMMRRQQQDARRREVGDRLRWEGDQRNARAAAQADRNLADAREAPFRRLALQDAQNQSRMLGAETKAMTRPAPTKNIFFGIGTTHNTMDPSAMSGAQRQVFLPQGSHFGGAAEGAKFARPGTEPEDRGGYFFDPDEAEAESDAPEQRFAKQNPYLTGMLTGRGTGRGTTAGGRPAPPVTRLPTVPMMY